MQVCPKCGEQNPDRFRVCGMCGAPLVPEAAREEARKTVTIVFCDLKGSTNLGEKLDTETLREVLNVYFTEMKTVLERHGGTVEKFIGDAVMAVFGLPRVHEDDALRAVRAAADMQRALARVNERLEAEWGVRLENRIGVNTGEVVAGDVTAGQRLVTGDAVNTAARLEQAAPAMEALIGGPTYRLVKDAVEVEPIEPLELKGKAEPVAAYRLVTVTREDGIARRLDAPMVGRAAELQVLEDALDHAAGTGTVQLVTVLGPAGVGKSRLLREFVARAEDRASAWHGRCLSYGDGITFWPLAEAVRGAAGITEDQSLEGARSKLALLTAHAGSDVAERIEAAIGLSPATFPLQETFWASQRLLETWARRRPLVVVFEDLHWAEQTFLDLIGHIMASATNAPIVIVCSARPEIRDEHPDWTEERDDARIVMLEPLSMDESSLVVDNILGSTALDQAATARILEAAGGNPLFVEQMLSMLIYDGILDRDERGRWILLSDIGTLAIPPSISALLTARLDRLGPTERSALERGSVIGQIFYRGAVEDLVTKELREHVGHALRSLVGKDLIRPDASTFAGQETFRFLHILIRDATYQGLLKRTRAELHERFVDWLERVAHDRVMEYEEIRGYHLEQAYLIRAQLGPLDEHGVAIGVRGATYLSSAGNRALARGDMPAAANLLRRASSLLPPTDPARPRLLLHAGEALIEVGELGMADRLLQASAKEAADLSDRGLQTTAELAHLNLRHATDPEESEVQVIAKVEQTIPILEQLGHHEGLARAWRILTLVHWTACRYGRAERAARRMIEHARLAGDDLMVRRVLPALAVCAQYGPMPATEAIARCEQLLEEAGTDRKAEALIHGALAHLEAMQGRFDRARHLYRSSRAHLEELGWNLQAALTSLVSGAVEMLAGDPAAAEAELRRDYETLRGMGEKNYISTTAAFLAEALYEQGRFDDAEAFTALSEEVAAPDDVSSQFLWRCVRAKVLARRRRFEEAEELARRGLDLIRATDELESQGNALMDLAEVLILADRSQEALGSVAQAEQLFESKGSVASARRASRLLEAIGSGAGKAVEATAIGDGGRSR